MKKLLSLFIISAIVLSVNAQTRSPKRGIGWDEKEQKITDAPIEKMLPGISWFYNWGPAPTGNASNLGTADGMGFAPMCWNGNYNETTIRNYVSGHKDGVKYLLGFNEPNFSAQANMTPSAAAAKWPGVEKMAEDLGLMLVAPALNFTGEKVGGKIWGIYEWLDEFIKLYKANNNGRLPKMDCLALHCYMNWYSANTWFATEYFYKDLYNASKTDVYGKYPNIVEYLDGYKAKNGHFPRMMLTEFCSWENDGTIKNVDFQIDQMTQKVQKLEQSDLVEGYAWFMGNAGGGASAYPYMSIFQTNSASSDLSTLGKVYVYMSSFDMSKFYTQGEMIAAKDYIDASTDDQQAKLRPNTESGSEMPLQVEMQKGAWTKYQIDVPASGDYKLTMHIKSTVSASVYFYIDGKKKATPTIASTNGVWADREFTVTLPAGEHSVMLFNAGSDTFLFNSWCFTSIVDGINTPAADIANGNFEVFNVSGIHIGEAKSLQELNLATGIYIIVTPSGERKKIKQ